MGGRGWRWPVSGVKGDGEERQGMGVWESVGRRLGVGTLFADTVNTLKKSTKSSHAFRSTFKLGG